MKPLDPGWDEALSAALAVPGAGGGSDPILFLEQRCDAVVELHGTDGLPRVRSSDLRGLSASRAGDHDRVLYRGDPQPDDAAGLVRALRGEPAPRVRTAAESPRSAPFPLREAVALLREAVERTAEGAPLAAISARWVGFLQEVRVAAPGRPVVGDVRQGGRVRIEARGPRCDSEVAVSEAVLPLDMRGARGVLERLPAAVAARLAEIQCARPVASGEKSVVFGPGVGGIFAHEVLGHALEADAMLSGQSWLAAARGRLATEELSVVDDPRRGRAAWKLDDEGEPSRPIALLRRGSACEWLHDARTSRLSGQPRTGHGRRGSFRDPVRPRMGCTFVAAGLHHPSETLEGIHDGIYVRRMEAAHADPRTGRAAFRVTDADAIRDGKLAGPVVSHLMLVDAPKALHTVQRIAADLAFDICTGSCVREGQPLATSVGAPTFRLIATMVGP